MLCEIPIVSQNLFPMMSFLIVAAIAGKRVLGVIYSEGQIYGTIYTNLYN